ncbi:TRAP transporter small permease subunit [Cobetia sp. L2A1]|uniref:TRAP transporter small permease subunit n=1 Tax=Cobetia sp. L2A1 TaxID=2686360 RepID=UPI00131AE9C5|nr:TRAP transporter small permease subunit [Cobetia sp. L2A1]
MSATASTPGWLTGLDRMTEGLGRCVSWLVVIMMLVEFAIVMLRYAFNVNSIQMQESVMYMHAAVFLLAASYTLKNDNHVRVDIFYQRMSHRGKSLVDLGGTLFLLFPVMIFIFLTSFGYVGDSWRIHESSPESGGLPGVYLLKTLLPAIAVLMLLQGVAEAGRHLLFLCGRLPSPHASEDTPDHDEELV